MPNISSSLRQHALEAVGTAVALNLFSLLCPPRTTLHLLKIQLMWALVWFLSLLAQKHYRINFFTSSFQNFQTFWYKLRLPIRVTFLLIAIFILYSHETLRCAIIGLLTSSGLHTYFSQAAQLRQIAQHSLAAKKSTFTKDTAPKVYEPSPARPPKRSVKPIPSVTPHKTKPHLPLPSPFKHIDPPAPTSKPKTSPTQSQPHAPIPIPLEPLAEPSLSSKRKHSPDANTTDALPSKHAKHSMCAVQSEQSAFDIPPATNSMLDIPTDSFVNRMMTSLKRRFSHASDANKSNNSAATTTASPQSIAIEATSATSSAPARSKRQKLQASITPPVFHGLQNSERLSNFLTKHTPSSALIPASTTIAQRPNIKVTQKHAGSTVGATESQLLEQHRRVQSNVASKAQQLLKGALSQYNKTVPNATQASVSVSTTDATVSTTAAATTVPTLAIPSIAAPSLTTAVPSVPTLLLPLQSLQPDIAPASDSKTPESINTVVTKSPPTHSKKPPPSPSTPLARKKSLDHSTMGIAFIGKADEKAEHQHVISALSSDTSFALPPVVSTSAPVSATASTSATTAAIPSSTSSFSFGAAPLTGLSGAIAASTANLPFGKPPAVSVPASLPFGSTTTTSTPSADFKFGSIVGTAVGAASMPFGSAKVAGGSAALPFGNPATLGGAPAFPLGTTSNVPKLRKKVTSRLKK